MSRIQEGIIGQIRKEAACKLRGFPREFRRQLTGLGDEASHQLTGGWGNEFNRQYFAPPRRRRRRR